MQCPPSSDTVSDDKTSEKETEIIDELDTLICHSDSDDKTEENETEIVDEFDLIFRDGYVCHSDYDVEYIDELDYSDSGITDECDPERDK